MKITSSWAQRDDCDTWLVVDDRDETYFCGEGVRPWLTQDERVAATDVEVRAVASDEPDDEPGWEVRVEEYRRDDRDLRTELMYVEGNYTIPCGYFWCNALAPFVGQVVKVWLEVRPVGSGWDPGDRRGPEARSKKREE